MGNSNSSEQLPKPTYSRFGILFGQVCKYGDYTKKCPEKIKQQVMNANLKGKRYLVTGASSGIGLQLCKILLQQGAGLVMASRSLSKLQDAQKQIQEEVSKNLNKNQSDLQFDIQLRTLDLSDIQQVHEFSQNLVKEGIELDGLINNGGALPTKQILKQYKGSEIEETLAVHIISPIILALNIRVLLEKRKGIILNNTSAGAYSQKLDNKLIQRNFQECLDRKKDDKSYFDGALVYAQCKRAMIESTTELVKYLKLQQNSQVKAISIHPGWAQTPGLDSLYEQQPSYKNYKFREPIESGYGMAYSIVKAEDMEDGKFYFDGKKQDFHKTFAGTEVGQKERDILWNWIINQFN